MMSEPDDALQEVEPAAEVDPQGARLAELDQKLRDTEARLRAVSKAYTEQKAEMAQFRERLDAQGRLALERKEFDVVSIFLDPVQDLQRSIEVGVSDPEAFLEGIRMVRTRFVEGLGRLGLTEVPGVGSRFDPALHDAIGTSPVEDPAEDGVVLSVAEAGYVHRGRVLKAARVIVGRRDGAFADA